MVMTMVNCCKDCTERILDCHSHCKRYKEAKEKHDQEQAEIRTAKRKYRDYVEFHYGVVQQIKKKSNHRK